MPAMLIIEGKAIGRFNINVIAYAGETPMGLVIAITIGAVIAGGIFMLAGYKDKKKNNP